MSKTEQLLFQQLSSKGFSVLMGKRAFNIVQRLQKEGKLNNMIVTQEVFNGNSAIFKSQWNSPKPRMVYETVVQLRNN
jgi:hypothetical protein